MGNPLTLEFWAKEEQLLWQSLDDLVMLALLTGMDTAASILPPALQPLIDLDFTNRAAIAFLEAYRLSTVQGISQTTRDQTVRAIQAWAQSGDPLPSLINRLTPLYGKSRAEAIAVTEVTRVFAAGNQILWDSTGVVSGKRWMTANDERVCPFCGPLHGQVVELNANFNLPPDAMTAINRAALARLGASVPNPPYHPRCRCWLQPFVSEVMLRDAIRSDLADAFFADVRAGKYEVFIG